MTRSEHGRFGALITVCPNRRRVAKAFPRWRTARVKGRLRLNDIFLLALIVLVAAPRALADRVTKRFGEGPSCVVHGGSMDTMVSSLYDTQNNGGSHTLHCYGDRHENLLFYYDLSTIPVGAKVYSARLTLVQTQSNYPPSNKVGIVQPLFALSPSGTGIWREAEATYRYKRIDGGVPVPWSAAQSTKLDSVIGAQIGSIYFRNWIGPETNVFAGADITQGAQAWVNDPAGNNGFVLPENPALNRIFAAKEYGIGTPQEWTQFRPYLEVTYEGVQDSAPPQAANVQATWHSGQTFITWKEANTGKVETSYRVYRSKAPITSDNLDQAERLDQVYQGSSYLADTRVDYTQPIAQSGIKQPDLTRAGVSLLPDSGLYVYPNETNEPAYYAVTTVAEGNENRLISAAVNATADPVAEQPGIPDAFYFSEYGPYTGYVMWMGSFNPNDTSDSFGFFNKRSAPVLFSVVIPFALTTVPYVVTGLNDQYYSHSYRSSRPEFPSKLDGKRFPLTVYLHASGHEYFDSGEGYAGANLGFALGFEDRLHMIVKRPDNSGFISLANYIDSGADRGYSYYAGWNSNYSPYSAYTTVSPNDMGLPKTFDLPQPFETGKSVMYGQKQMRFIIEWMLYHTTWSRSMDPERIFFTGASMGGGALSFGLHNADMATAVDVTVSRTQVTDAGTDYGGYNPVQWGPVSENIPLPDSVFGTEGIYDYLDLGKWVTQHPGLDFPPLRMLNGRNDPNILWPQIPQFYAAAQNSRIGLQAYFDSGTHLARDSRFAIPAYPDYLFYFYGGSPQYTFFNHMDLPYWNMYRYRSDQSYPAFSACSLDDNPGNGDPSNGSPIGALNRYTAWDTTTIVDTAIHYEVGVFLTDPTPSNSATVSITPRRLQAFPHQPGMRVRWRNLDTVSGQTLQTGIVLSDKDGLVTVPGFVISRGLTTLILDLLPPQTLAFAVQPAGPRAAAPLATQPVVNVLDAYGAPAAGFSGSVTITIKTGTGADGATLQGTTTVPVVNGVATFQDLAIATPGSAFVLTAGATGLDAVDSAPFDLGLLPGIECPSVLNVIADPGSCQGTTSFPATATGSPNPAIHYSIGGTAISPPYRFPEGRTTVVATATNAIGATSVSFDVVVTDIDPPVPDVATLPDVIGVCSATIVAPPTATDTCSGKVTGATTDALSYSVPGSHVVTWTYTDAFGNTSSQTQTAIVQPATRLAFSTQPLGASPGEAFVHQPVIQVLGAGPDPAACYTGSVSLSIKAGTGTAGATLSGTVSVPVVNGIATFTDLSIDLVGNGFVLVASTPDLPAVESAAFNVIVAPRGPWGDVDGDGRVTLRDADLTQGYLSGSPLSDAMRRQIRLFGDIAGTINRSIVGNDVVDANDVARLALLTGGIIDAGTAGPDHPGYGDVNGDGVVDIVDAVISQRSLNGIANPDSESRVHTRGIGDISPTVPFITFGDGIIDAADVDAITRRATGTETDPPAYPDYWPMHAPTPDFPDVAADTYSFTDLNGVSGDSSHQIAFQTQTPEEAGGYTITRVTGSDNSVVGVFKGIDGSIYAMFLEYPLAFGDRRVTFQSPVKVLDAAAARGDYDAWSGFTTTDLDGTGPRPMPFSTTVLSRGGAMVDPGVPASWPATIRVRLDVGILKADDRDIEMQQAFFFDFVPFIGVVGRSQAGIQGATVPEPFKPGLTLDAATVRGILYDAGHP